MVVPNILRKVPFKQKSNLNFSISKIKISQNLNNLALPPSNRLKVSVKSFLERANINTLWSSPQNSQKWFIKKGISIWNWNLLTEMEKLLETVYIW